MAHQESAPPGIIRQVDAPPGISTQPTSLSHPLPSERLPLTQLELPHLPGNLRGQEIVFGLPNVVVLAGSGVPKGLKSEVQMLLGDTPIENPNGRFPNLEEQVLIDQDVSGKRVVILQSATDEPAHGKMEVMAMADAAKHAGAANIAVMELYSTYSRAERPHPPGSHAVGTLLAKLYAEAGIDTIATFNIHAHALMEETKERINWVNIDAMDVLLPKLLEVLSHGESYPDLSDVVIVSPDKGGVDRAREYSDALEVPMVTANKKRRYRGENGIDGMELLDNEYLTSQGTKRKIKPGARAVVIDDMVDTGSTLLTIVELLKQEGASEVIIVAAHPVLSTDNRGVKAATKLVNSPNIDHIIFANTTTKVETETELIESGKLNIASVAGMVVDFIADYANQDTSMYSARQQRHLSS